MRDTSLSAAASVAGVTEQMRGRVLAEIRGRGSATCDEVEVTLGLKHQMASARIRELALAGAIADSGERRPTRSGCDAVVWRDAAEVGLQPILKWAGSKRFLIPRLRELYAPHRHRRLVEPFVGSMAVSLGLRPARALLGDVNKALVWFHERVRVGGAFAIEMANDEALYYRQRDRLNELLASVFAEDALEAGELFYYLNRTGFNGLCRFNASGQFNVPFGKYKTINYRREFAEHAELMRGWEIRCCGFHELWGCVASDDFVYADPPYDGTFSDYSAGGFDWGEQERLAVALSEHPGPVVVSNSAEPRVLEMYADLGFDVSTVMAPRSISAKGDRSDAVEMFATHNIAVDDCATVRLTVYANANADVIDR